MPTTIPRFCSKCNSLLSIPDMSSGLMRCTACSNTEELPTNDKRISIKHHNKEEKELTDLEVSRLMFEPTTAKKRMDCPNKECNNKIISVMRDDEYNNYILGCRKCETIFHY